MTADVVRFRWAPAQRESLLLALPRALNDCGVSEHLRGGLIRYVVDGVLPGGFLQACLCASLIEAARRGDPHSLMSLPGVVMFLEHYAPEDCWGSVGKVRAWTSTPDRLEITEP